VLKKSLFCCLSVFAAMALSAPYEAGAQFAPGQPGQQSQQQAPRPVTMPDEYKLNMMIRNAIIALNQANITGNYTVLRELGTPAFQVSNSPAKLTEIFATLRARKVDMSPIMFFPPKLVAAPAFQEGQILRLTGFFPTMPEQVNFDLAYQMFGDQWMLAGIAVNTAPATQNQRNDQISSQPQSGSSSSADAASKAGGEAKPIKIDLAQPAPNPGQAGHPAPHKKPVAAKKPKPPAQPAAPAQAAAPAQPAPAPAPQAEAQPQAQPAEEQPAPKSSFSSWNPFSR
jgi:hypothetical protein